MKSSDAMVLELIQSKPRFLNRTVNGATVGQECEIADFDYDLMDKGVMTRVVKGMLISVFDTKNTGFALVLSKGKIEVCCLG